MTAGSHVTWGGFEPRICIVCGRPVRLRESAFHGGAITGPWSVHAACGGPGVAARLDAHARPSDVRQEARETLENAEGVEEGR